MNTRRHPRTTLEAFGCDARSACAIERPSKRGDVSTAVLIGLGLALALSAWWCA